MSNLIPETAAAGTVVSWFWDKYGKELIDKLAEEFKKRFDRFKWKEAEEKYRSRLLEQHRFTQLLGNPKKIEIDDTYTDVFILSQPSAVRRFSVEAMQDNGPERDKFSNTWDNNRRPLLRLAVTRKRLYLLGKPGAGKTTFLKYLIIQACMGKIEKTPIIVELKDWMNTGLELLAYIVQQFDICAFPDAETFLLYLFEKGQALILFDGLDEVFEKDDTRIKMIQMLENFSNKYPYIHICITCRNAASDYVFTKFDYLEIADFTELQIQLFAKKWFQDETEKGERFLIEIQKVENARIMEISRTPLLLALLCLAYEQILKFPTNRTELYKDAFDTLLSQWDASRNIKRDEIYQKLSNRQKEKLLARIAYENFEINRYFIRHWILAEQIQRYWEKISRNARVEEIDGEVVLKAIEAQHGLLSERAHGIYSFSHLTFQEYLTARYILDNTNSGTLTKLFHDHLYESRWREIFIIIASLADDARTLFDLFLNTADGILRDDRALLLLTQSITEALSPIFYVNHKERELFFLILISSAEALDIVRKYTLDLQRAHTMSLDLDSIHDRIHNRAHTNESARIIDHARTHALDRLRVLAVELDRAISIANALEFRPTSSQLLSDGITSDTNNPNKQETLPRVDSLTYVLGSISKLIDTQNFSLLHSIADNLTKIFGDQTGNITIEDNKHELDEKRISALRKYLRINNLLLECLQIANIPYQNSILAHVYIPPNF